MKIIIGSANPQKIKAVQELAPIYEFMQNAEILGVSVESNISDQPKTLDEIILGAKNRAQNAFEFDVVAELGFGLESGIASVPHTKTGFMDLCACAIYDGEDFYIGLSGGFEPPSEVVRLINDEGHNMSEAVKKAKLTEHEYVGYAEGLIGILTSSKIDRLIYSKQAIQMALVRYENKHLY
jgi:inosine/xanthosine triphosphatase